MAQGEGSGGNVAIGCCAALAVVVVAGIMAAFMFAPKIVDKVKGAFESQEQLAEVMQTWEAVMVITKGNTELVSPAGFAGFTRDRQSRDTNPRGLDLGKLGHLDEYSNGDTTVSVWSARATRPERDAIKESITTQNEDRFSMRSSGSITTGGTTAVTYSGSPPKEGGLMVLSGNWIVLLQTNNPDLDLKDFLKQYVIRADASASSVEAATKGAAEAERRAAKAEQRAAKERERAEAQGNRRDTEESVMDAAPILRNTDGFSR